MKKNILYLIGFSIILILNYVIGKYFVQNDSESLNQITIFQVLKEGFRPIIIFLLLNFFSRNKIRLITFTIVMLVYTFLEFTARYFNGKEFIDSNYLFGMILGLSILFIINFIKNRLKSKTIETT